MTAQDDEITVRMLGPDDLSVFDRVADGTFDNPIRPDQAQAFLEDANHLIAVALAGDTVVGMATGVIYFHPDKPPQFWINEVGTAAPWRRRGIATRTTQALLRAAAAAGCVEMWLGTETDNTAARALYRALDGAETEGLVMYGWGAEDVE